VTLTALASVVLVAPANAAAMGSSHQSRQPREPPNSLELHRLNYSPTDIHQTDVAGGEGEFRGIDFWEHRRKVLAPMPSLGAKALQAEKTDG
jgi:hypothetical protein